MVARRGERLAERKNEGEKKKEAAAGEKGTPIYDGERGQGAGLRRIYTADTYTTGTSMYVRTYVYMYIYIVEDAGDHACARAYVRASYVRSFYYSRTPGSRLMLHNIGRHHWSKPGGINLNVF